VIVSMGGSPDTTVLPHHRHLKAFAIDEADDPNVAAVDAMRMRQGKAPRIERPQTAVIRSDDGMDEEVEIGGPIDITDLNMLLGATKKSTQQRPSPKGKDAQQSAIAKLMAGLGR
jgi:hypothetical protein